MDSVEILRRARCCACRGRIGETLNLVSLRRRPKWSFPTSGNLLTGDGPTAVAIVCDACIEAAAHIGEVIELRDGAVVYHDVESLEELPPEPTFVLVTDRGGPTGIRCLYCGLTSWHPDDVANLYCGKCHRYHENPNV